MELSPIVLFVYNRPWHTEQTLHALMKNELAAESNLYIYADGPKENATQDDIDKINQTRSVIRSKQWCRDIHFIESDSNKGLANSVIIGVTEILNQYGKVIVLEDDLVTSSGFLKYMNDALDCYREDEKVFHISGFMYPHKHSLPETFFFNVPLCWGWATWQRAWKYYNNDPLELFKEIDKKKLWTKFNKFGGNYLESQLTRNIAGSLKSWFVKWHASVLLEDGFTLFPGKSMVQNIGFDNSGVNNGSTNLFQHKELKTHTDVHPINLIEDSTAIQIIENFYYPKAKVIIPKNNFSMKLIGLLKKLPFKLRIISFCRWFLRKIFPELNDLVKRSTSPSSIQYKVNTTVGQQVSLYPPYKISDTVISNYTYIAENTQISMAIIGKYCSIGPNLLCGWGIHPTDGLSTSPMFYSTRMQNGMTFSEVDKVEERQTIYIGNDVFIGANVTILDGITIGDGAVIGAGAVVSKNIPAYAIAVGCPIKIISYRFQDDTINALSKIRWWDFDEAKLSEVEKYFYNVDDFIRKYDKENL